MCGISGLVLREGESLDARLLERMAESMKRRGPDAQGIFSGRGAGLAHRRLKILDLSDSANQPMWIEEGRLGIVYNGEVYNFRDLRAELERLGRRFTTSSDTEVILAAFREWGADSFARLNGMFALAILDLRGPVTALHLARDRFGIKPLFYSISAGKIAFASELKPLLMVPWISRKVNPQTLFHFLEFSHVPTPLSILEDVRQLEPGFCLRFADGKAEERNYASKNSLAEAADGVDKPESEWLDDFDSALARSVERHLVSDVPVGCFLSGGIDSSILLMACERLGARIESFTVGYEEDEFNEIPYARRIAEAFGSPHHEIVIRPEDVFDLVPDVPVFFDQPFADPTLLPSVLLAHFAREKVTVALSGDGGDELFFGYSQQAALYFMRGLARVPGAIRGPIFDALDELSRALHLGILHPGVHRGQKLAEILQFSGEAELFQYFVGTIGPLRRDRLARILQAEVDPGIHPFGRILAGLEGASAMDRILQVFLRTFLPDTVLAKTDRSGMAYGLETRVPFLDQEMFAFSSRLPGKHKLRLGQGKVLLRKSLERGLARKGLPTDLSRRRKQGFSIPLREWLRGDLKYLLDEYLGKERLRREGIFVPDEVHRLVLEHCGARANHSHLLWSLVSFQMWKEAYAA